MPLLRRKEGGMSQKIYTRRQLMMEAAYWQQWTLTEYARDFSPNGENFEFGGFTFKPQAGDFIEVKVDLTGETVNDYTIFLGSVNSSVVNYGYKFALSKNTSSPRLHFRVGTAGYNWSFAKAADNIYVVRWDKDGISVNGVYCPESASSYIQQVYNRYNRSQGEVFYFNGNVRQSTAFFHYMRFYKHK